MKMKKAFVLLNGEKPGKFPDLSAYEIVCAIDGAYDHFLDNNIEPDVVMGDFDSIESVPTSVEMINTPDQNFTDFDKALTILKEKGFTIIDVYGGSGKEHDHFLGNISTALQQKNDLEITFYDDVGKYFFIDTSFSTSNVLHKNISLIPFPKAEGIRTFGLQYTLANESLEFGQRIGTRNKAIKDSIKISFTKGNLLIYISN